MSFGKRRTDRGEPRRTVQVVPAKRKSLHDSPLWGQLGGLLAGFGAAVIFTIACDSSSTVLRNSMGESMKARFEGGPVQAQIANNSIREAPSDVALSNACPAPNLGFALSRGDPSMNAFNRAAMEEGEMAYKMGRHVLCIMEYDSQRFCSSDARSQLAKRMQAYLRMRRKARQLIGSNSHAQDVATAMSMVDGQIVRMSDATANAISALNDVDPDIIDRLRHLIKRGYLSANDFAGPFGFGMPEELAPFISTLKQQDKPCA